MPLGLTLLRVKAFRNAMNNRMCEAHMIGLEVFLSRTRRLNYPTCSHLATSHVSSRAKSSRSNPRNRMQNRCKIITPFKRRVFGDGHRQVICSVTSWSYERAR